LLAILPDTPRSGDRQQAGSYRSAFSFFICCFQLSHSLIDQLALVRQIRAGRGFLGCESSAITASGSVIS
jgi:hypothetical protein